MARSDWPIDVEKSKYLAKKVGARDKECWHNALAAMSMARNHGVEGLEYVEGFVVPESFPIVCEHAWLVLPDEQVIVDPTPVYHLHPERGYFPAVSFGRVGFATAACEVGQQPFARETEPDAWAAAYWAAQVWALGKEGVLYLHDEHLRDCDRRWIEEAEESPNPAEVRHG